LALPHDARQPAYTLRDFVYEIDCLEAGTAIRPENGQTYKWAIFCGPVVLGPVVEENRDMGEYQWGAARLGANYSDDNGGLFAATSPCQFTSLAECGCGPSDMYPFGLLNPAGPCLPEGGCPLFVRGCGYQVCSHSLPLDFPATFRGGWVGTNPFNTSWYYQGQMAAENEFEICIKESDT
jgi:hypothetical protein